MHRASIFGLEADLGFSADSCQYIMYRLQTLSCLVAYTAFLMVAVISCLNSLPGLQLIFQVEQLEQG